MSFGPQKLSDEHPGLPRTTPRKAKETGEHNGVNDKGFSWYMQFCCRIKAPIAAAIRPLLLLLNCRAEIELLVIRWLMSGIAPGLDPEAGALCLRLCVLREGDNVEKRG